MTITNRDKVLAGLCITLCVGSFMLGALANRRGPSSLYFEPHIIGEVERRKDGKFLAHYGDRVFVTYTVVRLRGFGNCLLDISRYAEEIGGAHNGSRHLVNHVELQFEGNNDLRRPQWPIRGLLLGTDFKLRDGVDEQEYALYVVARYYCGPVDRVFPRYIQGGIKPNETPRVNLIVKRSRP
jgi:hypothetical protein